MMAAQTGSLLVELKDKSWAVSTAASLDPKRVLVKVDKTVGKMETKKVRKWVDA